MRVPDFGKNICVKKRLAKECGSAERFCQTERLLFIINLQINNISIATAVLFVWRKTMLELYAAIKVASIAITALAYLVVAVYVIWKNRRSS